ncbi:ATP-binding protein [Carboxylicivirga sp. RSCT41]|uniref:sensor histidine kinase n=1 Tax=Carboxylicivirga agarovorans TaxID=3417570 RepID=UPI003D33C573
MGKINFTLLVFLSFQCALAENVKEYYHTTHLTSNEGLPHSLVFDIQQTNDGFIWLATNNGLGRYDGYEFKTFRPVSNSKNCPQGKSINRLFEDANNNLWLSVQGIGLNRLNLSTRVFSYYNDPDSATTVGNDVLSFHRSSDGTLWFGTNKGLHKYNAGSDSFVNCLPEELVFNVHQIDEDATGRLWIGTYGKLFVFDPAKEELFSVSELISPEIIESTAITQYAIWREQYLVCSTSNNGLVIYDLLNNELNKHLFKGENVHSFYVTGSGQLYFTVYADKMSLCMYEGDFTGDGRINELTSFPENVNPMGVSYAHDSKGDVWMALGNQLIRITKDKIVSQVISSNETGVLQGNIFISLIDDKDILWLRSERNGVIKIDLNQNRFLTYRHLADRSAIISGENISMVYEDSKKNIWVGCHSKGVVCYDRKADSYSNYLYDPNQSNTLLYRAPAGIVEDKNGDIWIGFYDGWLQKIDPQRNELMHYSPMESDATTYFDGFGIRAIIEDNNENLWFATNTKGLVEYDFKSEHFIYHSELYEEDYLSNSHYRFLTQTKNGIFWTGTQNGGLGRYDRDKKEFIHYKANPDDTNSISGNTVYFVHEESDSILFVGTDKGLNIFNRLSKKFTPIPIISEGVLCAIYRIYSNGDDLWLSGDCGIVKFDKHTYQYIVYNKGDGLPVNEFNTTAGSQTSGGEIFFGSSKGLVSFHPDEIKSNPFYPKPVLTELKIFNQAVAPGEELKKRVVLRKTISETDSLVLPYFLNDFTIEFSSTHFASPTKNKYQYRLEGYNSEWIMTDADRRWANYTGLKPGEYTFVLRASNNDGIMCLPQDEVHLTIIITPPYYETWWFRILMVFFISFIILFVIRYRMHEIREQKLNLEAEVAERTRELKNKNIELEESRIEVSKQNEELEAHRNKLEHLVEERTVYLEEALKKAEESDRLKTSFLSNMSHEIRTPMNAILGFTEIMRESDVEMDDIHNYINIIHNNAESLLNILNDIIDISMIETNQLVISKKHVNVKELVSNVFESYLKDGVCIQNPKVELKLQGEDIEIITDHNRLRQILNNLINNAIKFTPAGQVSVAYRKEGGSLLFEVQDSGIGIRPESINHVFDRFYRIDDSNEVYGGNGLGLAITKSLVEGLGGAICVDSECGKGTSFHFTIDTE